MTGPGGSNAEGTDQWQRTTAALSYVAGALSGALVLALDRQSRFVRFHAAQSIAFSLGVMALTLVLGSLPLVGRAAAAITLITAFVIWIVLMVEALRGRWYKLPYVGRMIDEQVR